jgi:DNA polymerase-3 subunit gamma/tau
MSTQALARKWRPKNFAQMVGQDATVRTLSNALIQDRLHHAYLFTGTRGVGKTTIARIIAKCLNCEQGITPAPCGECSTCQAIDAGQFIDLIEVDAASRTKVEDTRELLDNVQYAPTQGRFKIYLIDEVHMLSGHSFNALLKTLEEPPEHVKFLLATTDPQKLPITVLSRCLQFHLKGMAPEIISQHLEYILTNEKITFDSAALLPLSAAANGSMRDALSLLDQAIAFSDANITPQAVQDLLGATSTLDLLPLLDALAEQDGNALIHAVNELALQGVSFSQVLTDLLQLLHQINLAQLVPDLTQAQDLSHYAGLFSSSDIQLFYQIGLIGQRDLPFAPGARSGFEMIMLRMLCFQPGNTAALTPSAPSSMPTVTKTPATKTIPKSTPPINGETNVSSDIINQLKLSGMTKVLAQNCVLDKQDEHSFYFHIEAKHASMAGEKQVQQLQAALTEHLQRKIKVEINVAELTGETPAAHKQRLEIEKLATAKQNIVQDPHVQNILENFGGSLDENSITTNSN